MRKNISAILFFLLFFISCTSCSEKKSVNDNDTADNDPVENGDSDITDVDAVDADMQDTEKPEEIPDIDEDVYCPPLKEAGFPYSREDGSIHFCRECDKPTKNDPDCTVNLWKEANEELCTKEPEYDCCGYPCVMDKLRPLYKGEFDLIFQDQCDMVINAENPRGWQTGPRFFKHYNMSEGKVGIVMDLTKAFGYSNNIRTFEFDIATRKYKVLMQNGNNFTIAYHKGASFQTVTEKGIKEPHPKTSI